MPHHRRAFTIKEKGAIICRLENGESNSSLAKEFGVGHSTISMIFKNKNNVEKSFNSNVLKSKRIRKSTQDSVEKCLIKWFSAMRQKRIPISGPLLIEKANLFAKEMNINFKCTPSWISRFKTRHNIVMGKISGESAIVDKTCVNDWLSTVWPNLRERYSADDIFNADETGLFYKMMPDKTLKYKGEFKDDNLLTLFTFL
ncbi:tigger transposable element-derived protein 4-like [Leptopilina heterotoma]|uniref:tigger transposable element-derived protein 4-like n=1 Tax=Leptopilina heterotoma TaxID=63436 RepID=UPI001CA93492|nr:tigger transposable element-derived protein 4-like [Leptopilina heterotoma]